MLPNARFKPKSQKAQLLSEGLERIQYTKRNTFPTPGRVYVHPLNLGVISHQADGSTADSLILVQCCQEADIGLHQGFDVEEMIALRRIQTPQKIIQIVDQYN